MGTPGWQALTARGGAHMTETLAGRDVAAARRYDTWFEQGWGRYAWRLEPAAVLHALGPVDGRTVVEVGCGTGRLAAQLAAHGATVVGVDADPAMLTVAATCTPGRLRKSLWGWAGRVRHRAPYRNGCFLPRDRLLALGRRHGTATLYGVLFAFERLPWLPVFGPVLEAGGRLAPRLGAVHICTVHRGRPS